MIKVKIQDVEVELDFDVEDADCMERYEEALKAMQEQAKDIDEGNKSMSVKLRESCEKVFDFFNHVCGEGTDKILFGNKVNYRICFGAFESFIAETNSKITDLTQEVETIKNKYSQNRAQRRAK
jgi:hypothetical protein